MPENNPQAVALRGGTACVRSSAARECTMVLHPSCHTARSSGVTTFELG
jgi:hypothetical protein